MPKIVDKELMSQQIINASLQAFVKYGFYNTSMAKIAKEMNIAKGTLYLYFKSKEQLIETITDQYFENLKEKLIPSHFFKTPDMLLSHIEKSLLINDDESKFIPIFFEVFGPSFSSDEFITKYNQFFNEIADFYIRNFEILLDKGKINSQLEPKYFGRVLVSMLDGIVLHKGFFQMEDAYYNKMVKETIGLLTRGLEY